MEVEVIASETENDGQKGLFDVGRLGTRIARQSVSDLSASFQEFCTAFSAGLSAAEAAGQEYQLERVELSADVTVKGELRIIASASAETKGSIKLIFSRRPRVPSL